MTDHFTQAQRQWEEEPAESDAGSVGGEDCGQRKCKCPELDEI